LRASRSRKAEYRVNLEEAMLSMKRSISIGLGLAALLAILGVTQRTSLAATLLQENFDGVVAPALPAGWSNVNLTTCASGVPWTTAVAVPDTAPNTAFVNDPNCIDDRALVSPVFQSAADALLAFRNWYDLESSFDGGVLEMSVSGGPFQDIIVAGGSFKSGAYNSTISVNFGSPIGGRQAWSGNPGGYINTLVCLPPSAAGQSVQLRWRRTTDNSVADVGWRVDTIRVLNDSLTCAAPTPTPTPTSQPPATQTPIAERERQNVGGAAGAIGAAVSQQAKENRERAAAPAPQPTVAPPRTGTGISVSPPRTGDAGLASPPGATKAPLAAMAAAIALGGLAGATVLRRRGS
jgi:hypothetical protein